VRRRKIALKLWGDCCVTGSGTSRRFQIRIDREANDDMAREVLMHEWAHALAWRHLDDNREDEEWHTDVFGCVYAKIYRAVFDEGEFSTQPEK
jgi:predicted SprT family Zn-dependent metalloprotease